MSLLLIALLSDAAAATPCGGATACPIAEVGASLDAWDEALVERLIDDIQILATEGIWFPTWDDYQRDDWSNSVQHRKGSPVDPELAQTIAEAAVSAAQRYFPDLAVEDAARALVAQVAKESTFDPEKRVFDPQGVTLGLTQMRLETSYQDWIEGASAEGLLDASGRPWDPAWDRPIQAMMDPWKSIHMGAFIMSIAARSGGAYVKDAVEGEIVPDRPMDLRAGYHVHSRGPTAWQTGDAPTYNQTEAWGDFYTEWNKSAIAALGGDPQQVYEPLMSLAELQTAGYAPFWEGPELAAPAPPSDEAPEPVEPVQEALAEALAEAPEEPAPIAAQPSAPPQAGELLDWSGEWQRGADKPSSGLSELSGLAPGPDGTMYAIDDGLRHDWEPKVYHFDASGQLIGAIDVDMAKQTQPDNWESVDTWAGNVVVGNVGNYPHRTDTRELLVIAPGGDQWSVQAKLQDPWDPSRTTSADIEATFIDPLTGDYYLVEKSYNDDDASLWRIDADDWTGGAAGGLVADYAGALPIPWGVRPTDASMSADGTRLVLASYDNSGANHPLIEYAIDRSDPGWSGGFGDSLSDLIASGAAQEIAYPDEYRKMNEAVTYLGDGSGALAVWAENDLPLYTLDATAPPAGAELDRWALLGGAP